MKESTILKHELVKLVSLQQNADKGRYYPNWHLAPVTGLMNDPNGFIQFDKKYHLFYQWNPFACQHGAKFWGHWSSQDLIHWVNEPVALVPAQPFESHGCYSGSAVNDNGVLTLLYSGNVKRDDGSRTSYQCLAYGNAQGEFIKHGPVLDLPEGYTGHVRDPKVWRKDDYWYMVLGAQNQQKQGKVLLFRSKTLKDWQNMGELAGAFCNGLADFGYMWECPDLIHLNNNDILLCCPQGLPAQSERYLNTFQSGYFVGQLDYSNGNYSHGDFHELDNGFEFYAPQTTQADDGRYLLVGWMGIPDENEFDQPTIAYQWIHTMTCIRQLSWRHGLLCQTPVDELKQLRGQELVWQGPAEQAPLLECESAEIQLTVEGALSIDFATTLTLNWDGECLTLIRNNLRTGIAEHRYWRGELTHLQILCDRSSVEIFINHGEAVMTSRYFPQQQAQLKISGNSLIMLSYWPLSSFVVT